MKPSKFFLAALLLLAFTCSWARVHRTVNITNAQLTYNTNGFLLSGITWSTDAANMADAFLRIFIETGDGNYIQHTATFSINNNGTYFFPYEYLTSNPVNVSATLVKTYDKGGPRSKLMTIPDMRPVGNADANNNLQYPATAVTLFTFDRVVVPEDVMTGVITINNKYLNMTGATLTFHLDNLLPTENKFRVSPNAGLTFTSTPGESFETHTLTVSGIDANEVVNIFFNIIPAGAVADYPDGQRLVFDINGFTDKTGLTIARSHDPNSLSLVLDCDTARANLLTYLVQVENTGIAPESDISIGLKFNPNKFDRNSIRITSAKFGGERKPFSITQKLTHSLGGTEMDECEIIITFRGEKLSGINRLPSGHPLTRGQVVFSMKRRGILARGEDVNMQAVIKFGGAGKPGGQGVLTPTNVISVSPEDIRNACRYRSKCRTRYCDLCIQTQLKNLWLCQ